MVRTEGVGLSMEGMEEALVEGFVEEEEERRANALRNLRLCWLTESNGRRGGEGWHILGAAFLRIVLTSQKLSSRDKIVRVSFWLPDHIPNL